MILLLACFSGSPADESKAQDSALRCEDHDQDGYCIQDGDCDDNDPSTPADGRNPGAVELCDYIDNDCDGQVDEEVTTTVYADRDGDGFGDSGSEVDTCSASDGYVTNGEDCDDTDASINPGATEVCDDADNTCDGRIDEGCSEAP